MLRRFGMGVLALGACGVLAVPAAARTKTVFAGSPPIAKKIAGKYVSKAFVKAYNPDVNAFFNHRTTIHVGDKVAFVLAGFHTVDLPGTSKQDLPFIVPGATASGYNDAAGNPFWFNGKVPTLGLNPVLFSRSKARSYNGRARLDSGLPLSPKTKPFVVKFSKAGTYKFFCDVHPGMVGFVTVRPKSKPIPSGRQDLATEVKQFTRDVKAARRLAFAKQPKNTVSLGESSPSGVELYTMFPASLTVKKGTTVTFRMSRFTRESHTASFGPASYLKPLAKSFEGASFSPVATYPSDPGQPLTLSPTSHGNGFVNTGVLDQDRTTPLLPSSKIDFTTPGTYHFVCLIHPFMHGTIVVTK